MSVVIRAGAAVVLALSTVGCSVFDESDVRETPEDQPLPSSPADDITVTFPSPESDIDSPPTTDG